MGKIRDVFLPMHGKQEVETPEWLLQAIKIGYLNNNEFFDPCPLNPTFDGLNVPWHERNYVNPPYNNIEPWLRKAVQEMTENNRKSVFLIPFRPHTGYWEDLVLTHACEVSLFKQQIKFKGYRQALPLPLALVVFDPQRGERQVVVPLGPVLLLPAQHTSGAIVHQQNTQSPLSSKDPCDSQHAGSPLESSHARAT